MQEEEFKISEPPQMTYMNRQNNMSLDVSAAVEWFGKDHVYDPDSGKFYKFNGLIYKPSTISRIDTELYSMVKKAGMGMIKTADWTSFEKNLKSNRITDSLLPRDNNKIYFEDAIYDIFRDETTTEGDPDMFVIDCLHVRFSDVKFYLDNPDVTPMGVDYLRKLMVTKDAMDMLMECAGCYLFDRDRRFNPILYVYGISNSGKTHIGNVLKNILGARASPVGLPKKDDSGFNLHYAYKDLMCVDEIEKGELSSYAMNEFKQLTSATDYMIYPKGKESFSIPQTEKPMIYMTSNYRPAFDYDSGVASRMGIIRVADILIDTDNYHAWLTDDFKAWMVAQALTSYKTLCKRTKLLKSEYTMDMMSSSGQSILTMWLEEQKITGEDNVRDFFMNSPCAPTARNLLYALQDFEKEVLRHDKPTIKTSTINSDLDILYGLEWYKQRKMYRDIRGRSDGA